VIRFRKYNTLLVTGTTAIRIPIVKRGVVDHAVGADWTPASGDVKISIDGAAPANVTNLPVATASGNSALWEFILTAAELTCKQAIVTISDSATKAIEDDGFVVETFGHASAMYAADWSAAKTPATIGDGDIAADAINAASLKTDAVTKIQNGLASQTSVDDLPTNAEMALMLAAADDAMLSAIGAVQSDTNDIQTRIPPALVNGKMDSVASVTLDADDIDDIAAAVIDGLGNQAINIVSPFAVGGALTVFTGDAYLAANNTSLRFNLVGRSDLIGLIPHLIGKCGTSFDLTAAAVVSGTETMTFSDLTGAVTSLLTPGAGSAPERGEYQIRFYDGSGNKVTETSGIMYVRRGLS